jgi:EAL domain-containing protein (putative c-di-GMP-specific phosphodiesterase class I)
VVQGYFFSKPMPVADCDVYLQAQSAGKGATVGPEVLPT